MKGTNSAGNKKKKRKDKILFKNYVFLLVLSSDPTLNERRSWLFFWVRLGAKSFLFGYPRSEKQQKLFPLSLHPGRAKMLSML